MNYHGEHIPYFADIPLHKSAKPKEPYEWNEEQQLAFEKTKNIFGWGCYFELSNLWRFI